MCIARALRLCYICIPIAEHFLFLTTMSSDLEKKTSSIEKESPPRYKEAAFDPELDEPTEDESLHRAIKARQISMIAVSVSQVS